MAKIQEEVIVIKLSKLVKDGAETTGSLADSAVVQSLEEVVQELVGSGIIVEVEKA